VTEVLQYVGLPHRVHGRDRNGLDCWGLVRLWYREQLDILLPEFESGYVSLRDKSAIESLYLCEVAKWREVKTPGQDRGDLVMWKIAGHWSHVGVMLDSRSFLHTAGPTIGSAMERLSDLRWRARTPRFYRLP